MISLMWNVRNKTNNNNKEVFTKVREGLWTIEKG